MQSEKKKIIIIEYTIFFLILPNESVETRVMKQFFFFSSNAMQIDQTDLNIKKSYNSFFFFLKKKHGSPAAGKLTVI